MKIESSDLVKEYYKAVREKYPDLTLQQLEEVVRAPWQYLREEMESGRLENVRFKYLGIFRVYKGRAKAMYKLLPSRLERNLITQSKHDRAKAAIAAYMERNGISVEEALAFPVREATMEGGAQ